MVYGLQKRRAPMADVDTLCGWGCSLPFRILLANCPEKAKRSDGKSRRGAINRAQGWGGADTIAFTNSIFQV